MKDREKKGNKKSSQRFFLCSNLRPSGLVDNQVKSQTRNITAVCHIVEPLDASHAMNLMQMKQICWIETKMFGTEENGKYLQPIMSFYCIFPLVFMCLSVSVCVSIFLSQDSHLFVVIHNRLMSVNKVAVLSFSVRLSYPRVEYIVIFMHMEMSLCMCPSLPFIFSFITCKSTFHMCNFSMCASELQAAR